LKAKSSNFKASNHKMINIKRGALPKSLNSPEIQQYITDAVNHLDDPQNVSCPKKPESYRTSDLLEAFDIDFYSKCYLTEEWFSNSWSMDVEHFIPKNERPDLVYEWTNLFPASHYANMIKPRKTPPGGYLNPCTDTEDVESEIIYTLAALGADPYFEARNPQNIKAVNTASLLIRIHNGHDENTKKATKNLRFTISKKYDTILNTIIKWQGAKEGSQEKFQFKRELKELLSRKSHFTMLCRSIPAVRQNLPSDFFD
jgi:hypothetical protein